MTFSQALKALMKGKIVALPNWDGLALSFNEDGTLVNFWIDSYIRNGTEYKIKKYHVERNDWFIVENYRG